MIRYWVKVSFIFLVIAAVLGVFLRYLLVSPVEGLNFKHFLHSHSHVAFLGWVFNALFAGIIFAFIPWKANSYRLLFWLLQIAVAGMLVMFPIQGYAAASITFSTLHIILSWWFAIKFYRDTRHVKNQLSLSFVRWSLLFMVISAAGPFALGAIMAQGLSDTPLYNLSIYFYLHFQYNGWFSFAIFGLFFRFLETNGVAFSGRQSRFFLILMLVASIPGYALSALWLQPEIWVYILGIIAGTAQVLALVYLFLIIQGSKEALKSLVKKPVRHLLLFSFSAFLLKVILQFGSGFPALADLAYRARNLTIGYLHIVFLGFVTLFLISWFMQHNLLNTGAKGWSGIKLFLAGFIVSELIIFLQPLLILGGVGPLPFGEEILFAVSLLMPAGIILLFFKSDLYAKRNLF